MHDEEWAADKLLRHAEFGSSRSCASLQPSRWEPGSQSSWLASSDAGPGLHGERSGAPRRPHIQTKGGERFGSTVMDRPVPLPSFCGTARRGLPQTAKSRGSCLLRGSCITSLRQKACLLKQQPFADGAREPEDPHMP